ncbi:MAG: regulatory protein RecX [Acidiferrobacterales bacterium]
MKQARGTRLAAEQDEEDSSAQTDRRNALNKAIACLARREHSAFELVKKLERSGIALDLVNEVVGDLQRQGLVSDQRFAEAFIRYRSGKGYGPQRIEMELNEKRIDRSLISLVLESSECNWVRLAIDVRAKKFGTGQPADYKERARQARFLQYRGFTGEQIRVALGGEV